MGCLSDHPRRTFDLRRLWRLPFVALGLSEILLLVRRVRQLGALHADPAIGRDHEVWIRNTFSGPGQIYYLTADQHQSVVWFALGIATFLLCYFAGNHMVASGGLLSRVSHIDAVQVEPRRRCRAFAVMACGALASIFMIVSSYSRT